MEEKKTEEVVEQKKDEFVKIYGYIKKKEFNILLSILWNGKTEPPNIGKFVTKQIRKYIKDNSNLIQPPRHLSEREKKG